MVPLYLCAILSALRRSAWASNFARWAAACASITCLDGCFTCCDAVVRSLFLSLREPPAGNRRRGRMSELHHASIRLYSKPGQMAREAGCLLHTADTLPQ